MERRRPSCVSALTHTKQAHMRIRKRRPDRTRTSAWPHTCMQLRTDPKSAWSVSDISYLTADNDTSSQNFDLQQWDLPPCTITTYTFREFTWPWLFQPFLHPLNESNRRFKEKTKTTQNLCWTLSLTNAHLVMVSSGIRVVYCGC